MQAGVHQMDSAFGTRSCSAKAVDLSISDGFTDGFRRCRPRKARAMITTCSQRPRSANSLYDLDDSPALLKKILDHSIGVTLPFTAKVIIAVNHYCPPAGTSFGRKSRTFVRPSRASEHLINPMPSASAGS